MCGSKKQAMHAGLIQRQVEIEIRSVAVVCTHELCTAGAGVRHLGGAAVERHKMRLDTHGGFKPIDRCAVGVGQRYAQILGYACFKVSILR